MRITLDPALPCGQVLEASNGSGPPRLCGRPAAQAIVAPLEGGEWELLPICPDHLQEALCDLDEASEHGAPFWGEA